MNLERIYDYFTIIGVIEEEVQSPTKDRENKNQTALQFQVIDRYPRNEDPDFQFPVEIPYFCFPHECSEYQYHDPKIFQFILTSQQGKRFYCNSLVFVEEKQNSLQDYYQPKAICLISHFNYSSQTNELLKQIFQFSQSKNSMPIEVFRYFQLFIQRLICNIIDELGLQEFQQSFETKATIYLGQKDIEYIRYDKYPYCSQQAIESLFQILDKNNIITLIQSVLLEKKIHLVSKSIALPSLIVEAITCLIFPFEYIDMLIPILPDQLSIYKEAPVPFIIGYNENELQFNKDVKIHYQINKDIYVLLDQNKILNTDTLPQLSSKAQKILHQNLPNFTLTQQSSLRYIDMLDIAFPQFSMEEQENQINQDKVNLVQIRETFLRFINELIKDYKKFYANGDVKNSNHQSSDFLNQFTQTQTFSYFIQNKNQLTEKSLSYQFFDIFFEGKDGFKENISKKVIFALTPNIEGLSLDQKIQYKEFPILNENNFVQSRIQKQTKEISPNSYNIEDKQIYREQYTDQEWSEIFIFNNYRPQVLLVSVYKTWLMLMVIKLRQNFASENLQPLVIFAIELFNQNKKKVKFLIKHQKLNSLRTYSLLIEACGLYKLQEEALILVQCNFLNINKKNPNSFKKIRKSTYNNCIFKLCKKSYSRKNLNHKQFIIKISKFCVFKQQLDFYLSLRCPGCNKKYKLVQVLQYFRHDVNNNFIQCTSSGTLGCNKSFQPRFFFQLNKRIKVIINDSKQFMPILLSPLLINRIVQDIILNLQNLSDEISHTEQILNSEFYFDFLDLPPLFQNYQFCHTKTLQCIQKQQQKRYKQQNLYGLSNPCDIYQKGQLDYLIKDVTDGKNLYKYQLGENGKSKWKIWQKMERQFENRQQNDGCKINILDEDSS